MVMSQASRDATMASFSLPLTKYTFSTVPTASRKWEYNHISSPPSLQLLLRPHELAGGYCLEIISGTDKLETVDLSRLARLSNSHSQSTQSNSEVPVCVIYHNLNIAFKYPISTIETRRIQLKFLNGDDYLFVIDKFKKFGLPARPHQPSLKPSSVRRQNTSPRPQHDMFQTTVPPMTNQISRNHHGPTLDTGVGENLTYTLLSSSPLHLSSSPAPRPSPVLNIGSSVPQGRNDTQIFSSHDSGFVEASPASKVEHQMSRNPYISTVGGASDADFGTASRFFHQPDQLSARPPLSRSSTQANTRQLESLRPSSSVETPSQPMRPPILGHEFETALTAARRVTSNLERPSTAFSTASDNTLTRRYAEMHESFRPTSVQPATNKDNLRSFMPPKRILPFPSLGKKSTLKSANTSQTDPSLSESPKTKTGMKDASKSNSHKIRNPSSLTVAEKSQNLKSPKPTEHPCTSQISVSHPGIDNYENTALLVAELKAAANRTGKDIEKGTEQPIPPKRPQDISGGQKRMIIAPEVPSPKRRKTMVDHSTQTQTNSGRDHTASLNIPTPARKSHDYKDQDTQTPSVLSSLLERHQGAFKKDQYPRPATDALAIPDYHSLPENERHSLLNNYLFECLDDPNFMKLCKDMDKCWRGAVLIPRNE